MTKRPVRTFLLQLAVPLGGVFFSQLGISSNAAAQSAPDPDYYDWVPSDELPSTHQSQLGPACRGAYVDPMASQATGDPAEATIYIEADSTQMDGPSISLQGDVQISQGPRQLRAERMFYDQQSEQAELEGKVLIRQPGLLVRGSGAMVNMAGNEARFQGGEFVLHDSHLRGRAENLEQLPSGVVVLEDGAITSCEPYREAWRIRGDKLSVNPRTRRGYGRNVWVDIGGMPVLYVPFITFPVGSARQSGLLFPTVGTNDGKIDFAQPFYWNLAPNYDATLTPRYAGGRGAMIEGELRHLSEASSNMISFGYLPQDDGGGDPDIEQLLQEGYDERLLRPYRGEDRWLLNFVHQGGDNSRWYSDVAYTKASDIDYLRDLSVASFDVAAETHLSQSAVVGYRLPNWHLSMRFQSYQNLLADLEPNYRQLPRLQANGGYQWGDWGLELFNELAHFTHEDDDFVTGSRSYTDYSVSWQQQQPWGFVRPRLGVQTLAYDLEDDNLRPDADSNPALATGYASMDTGLVFERNNGRQLLQPRLFYLYRQYTDHSDLYGVTDPALGPARDVNFDTTALTFSYGQLFRDRRFIGNDRLGDAHQLSLGVTSQWFNGQTLDPVASMSFGQVLYFNDRRVLLSGQSQAVTLQESDLAAQMFAQVTDNLRLAGDFLYNPKTGRMMRASTGIGIGDGYRRHLNLAYRYVREDTLAQATQPVDQLDATFTFPAGDQWQLVGRMFYDLEDQKELDTFAGFEYDDCCYRVRLLARRWLDSKLADLVEDTDRAYDTGVFLEIDFKGLASSGERVQQLLAEHLPLFRR